MKHRIADRLADCIVMYLSIDGRWDLGKSEKRRKQVQSLLIPPASTISNYEKSCLRYAARKRAIDNLLAAIFSPKITIVYGKIQKSRIG